MSGRHISELAVPRASTVLLTGDLHLAGPDTPEARLFLRFLDRAASPERILVVAGDLFYYYFENAKRPVEKFRWLLDALEEAAGRWESVVLMHGNRDFLLGGTSTFPDSLRTAGDFLVLEYGSKRALVTHGDLFLRGDRLYYAFRKVMRSPPAVWFTRRVPPEAGIRMAEWLRWISFRGRGGKGFLPPDPDKIIAAARAHGADEVYFGHFHRMMTPADFPFERPACWCVGAWEDGRAPVLVTGADGVRAADAGEF